MRETVRRETHGLDQAARPGLRPAGGERLVFRTDPLVDRPAGVRSSVPSVGQLWRARRRGSVPGLVERPVGKVGRRLRFVRGSAAVYSSARRGASRDRPRCFCGACRASARPGRRPPFRRSTVGDRARCPYDWRPFEGDGASSLCASETSTTGRVCPTRLETRTEESDVRASLWVKETLGRNESERRRDLGGLTSSRRIVDPPATRTRARFGSE